MGIKSDEREAFRRYRDDEEFKEKVDTLARAVAQLDSESDLELAISLAAPWMIYAERALPRLRRIKLYLRRESERDK